MKLENLQRPEQQLVKRFEQEFKREGPLDLHDIYRGPEGFSIYVYEKTGGERFSVLVGPDEKIMSLRGNQKFRDAGFKKDPRGKWTVVVNIAGKEHEEDPFVLQKMAEEEVEREKARKAAEEVLHRPSHNNHMGRAA